MHLSKDFPTSRTHRLGTLSVRVMKDAGIKGVTKNIAPSTKDRNENTTATVLKPSIDTSSSIVSDIKKSCNQLSKQIGVMKKSANNYSNDFILNEVQNAKQISLDLQQYCCDLEKIFKENQKKATCINCRYKYKTCQAEEMAMQNMPQGICCNEFAYSTYVKCS